MGVAATTAASAATAGRPGTSWRARAPTRYSQTAKPTVLATRMVMTMPLWFTSERAHHTGTIATWKSGGWLAVQMSPCSSSRPANSSAVNGNRAGSSTMSVSIVGSRPSASEATYPT